MSIVFKWSELRYQKIEHVALTFVVTTRNPYHRKNKLSHQAGTKEVGPSWKNGGMDG